MISSLHYHRATHHVSGMLSPKRPSAKAAANDFTAIPSLTLDHTKRLTRQSIRTHLCRRLLPDPLLRANSDGQPHPPGASSSRTPPSMPARPASRSPARPEGHAVPPPNYRDETSGVHRRPVRQDLVPQRKLSNPQGERPSLQPPPPDYNSRYGPRQRSRSFGEDAKRIFKPLEDYVATCFGSFDCVNSAFPSRRSQPSPAPKPSVETIRRKPVPSREPLAQSQATRNGSRSYSGSETMVPELDPKLLLLGDVGENGTWWTGPPPEATLSRNNGSSVATSQTSLGSPHTTSHSHSPHLNWEELAKWYHCVINAAEDWFIVYEELSQEPTFIAPTERDLRNMESDLLYAQEHVQIHLMKATELLLKRPGRPL